MTGIRFDYYAPEYLYRLNDFYFEYFSHNNCTYTQDFVRMYATIRASYRKTSTLYHQITLLLEYSESSAKTFDNCGSTVVFQASLNQLGYVVVMFLLSMGQYTLTSSSCKLTC